MRLRGRGTASFALLITLVALAGRHGLLRALLHILAQRSANIGDLVEPPLLVAPHIALVGAGIDQLTFPGHARSLLGAAMMQPMASYPTGMNTGQVEASVIPELNTHGLVSVEGSSG
jgi:hypothetical protein